MRKTLLYCSAVLFVAALASCNGSGTTTTTSDSTHTTQLGPGDSAVTTTTTTTVVHHKYSGTFMPQPNTQYIDLRTNKRVQVRIDTNLGQLVNTETQQPVDLIVEPGTHDTIYGQTGTVVNNYITKDESGNYQVDTVREHTVDTVVQQAPPVGKEKIKTKDNGQKIKEKIK